MSLRDYFAGQALVAVGGLLFNGAAQKNLQAEELARMIAESSYEIADVMIEARDAGK